MDFMEEGGDKQKAYRDLYFQEIDNIVTTGVFLKFGPFLNFQLNQKQKHIHLKAPDKTSIKICYFKKSRKKNEHHIVNLSRT